MVIEVVKITLSLEGMFVECVEAVECKNRVGSRERRRKPAQPQKLGSSIRRIVIRALAVVDINKMDTRGVKNHEIGWTRGRARASTSAVSKLYAESKVFEGILVEKLPCPSLR